MLLQRDRREVAECTLSGRSFQFYIALRVTSIESIWYTCTQFKHLVTTVHICKCKYLEYTMFKFPLNKLRVTTSHCILVQGDYSTLCISTE